MGSALLKGWLNRGIGSISVVEPKPSVELRKLARAGKIALFAAPSRVQGKPSVCVVAIKPQVLKDEASMLAGFAQAGALMISIAAGTSVEALMKSWGRRARIIRAMPNTPGAIGRGISVLYAANGTTAKDKVLAEQLLSALGETLWVKHESDIDIVTALSGSGPAYVFLLVEALAAAGEAEGLSSAIAERLARATIIGSGALLGTDASPAAQLRRNVTSPGGTTEAALKVLMSKGGLSVLMRRAVAAARRRAHQLGS
jgi:pyrroline-5-carboxylate reductase